MEENFLVSILESVPCYFKILLIMLDSRSFTDVPGTGVFYKKTK